MLKNEVAVYWKRVKERDFIDTKSEENFAQREVEVSVSSQ